MKLGNWARRSNKAGVCIALTFKGVCIHSDAFSGTTSCDKDTCFIEKVWAKKAETYRWEHKQLLVESDHIREHYAAMNTLQSDHILDVGFGARDSNWIPSLSLFIVKDKMQNILVDLCEMVSTIPHCLDFNFR